MIIARLRGGLGNQLFQYAAGRRLAWCHQVALKLDIEPLLRSADRNFALRPFQILAGIATERERRRYCAPSKVRRLSRRLIGKPVGAVMGGEFGFDPAILDLPDDVCLDGYWQSEDYFADAEQVIRNELRFRNAPTGRNRELADEMSRSDSVSLHVRRGDYLTHQQAKRILGPCGFDYYRHAVRRIASTARSLRIYIFSDDPDWSRRHMDLGYPTEIVDHNGPEQAHEDLRLMSLCQHHVIANSTFSWWSAWLAEGDGRLTGKDRIIIAPRRWYNSDEHNADDLVPARWLRL